MSIAAVVTAAGYGTRLGSDLPKALVLVAGRSLLAWALDRTLEVADTVVVTAPPTHVAAIWAVIDREVGGATRVAVVPGGATRQESVAAGLAALVNAGITPDDIVLVHDAARAFMPVGAMRAAIAAIESGADGAVPVIPVVDTIVGAPGPGGELGELVDRDSLRAVQTPQVFRAAPLLDAHDGARTPLGAPATDDATLVRNAGYRVVATVGDPAGFKVTLAGDLALAEHLAGLS